MKLLTATHYGNKLAFSALAQLSVAYPDSVLTHPGKMGSVSAGERMPNFRLADGTSVYDQLHAPGHQLIWLYTRSAIPPWKRSELTYLSRPNR